MGELGQMLQPACPQLALDDALNSLSDKSRGCINRRINMPHASVHRNIALSYRAPPLRDISQSIEHLIQCFGRCLKLGGQLVVGRRIHGTRIKGAHH